MPPLALGFVAVLIAGGAIRSAAFTGYSAAAGLPPLRRGLCGKPVGLEKRGALRGACAFAAKANGDADLGSQEPLFCDDALAKELRALRAIRASTEAEEPAEDPDALSLQRRMAEVRHGERFRALTRLLRMRVVNEFRNLNLTLAQPMKGSSEATLGHADLRTLATGFYPDDAMELVRDHVLSVISHWEHLVRDFPLQLALLQVGQLYSMSAVFGYSLRRAVTRYQLDRLAGGLELAGRSLKEYVSSFGPEEMEQAVSVASQEAQAALNDRLFALFGDLGQLWDDFQAQVATSPPGEAAISEAIEHGKVESIRITVGDLRQLVLEGTGYGFLLGNAEAALDSTYELTASPSQPGMLLFGGGLSSERRILPWSRAFGSESH